MNITLIDLLQWAGCSTGLAGALTLATGPRHGALGFGLFLSSNFLWIAFALLADTPGLLVMSLGYMVTSLIGIYKWGVAPSRAARAQAAGHGRVPTTEPHTATP